MMRRSRWQRANETQQRHAAFVDCWGVVLPALGKPVPREECNGSKAGTTGAERKRRLNQKLGGMGTERSSVAREMEMEVKQDGTNT